MRINLFFICREPQIAKKVAYLHRKEKSSVMDNNKELLQYLHYHPLSSRKDISEGMSFDGSDATLKRRLATEIQAENVVVSGNNKSTRYSLSARAQLLMPLNLDTYFAKDIDER